MECMNRPLRSSLVLLAMVIATACSSSQRLPETGSIDSLRRKATATTSERVAAQWLLAELIAPGGDAARAREARRKLDSLRTEDDMLAHLARGLDDSVHGRLDSAPDAFLRAAEAARQSDDPNAPLFAWYAVTRALALTDDTRELYRRWEPLVVNAMRDPRQIGWRARWDLVDWWLAEHDTLANPKVDELAVEQLGCVRQLRIAGPFGTGARADAVRSFPAERPGPWPHRWNPEPGVSETPRVLATTRHGCSVSVEEPVGDGVFYAETFLDLEHPRELLLAAQGALAVWVDDRTVLDRDIRQWGVWPKFGVKVKLRAGRHRVLARLSEAKTSIRVLAPGGQPANVRADRDASAPYCKTAPVLLDDPNLISRYVEDGDVVDPGDDLVRMTAAFLAKVEGQADLASLLLEPLLKEIDRSTGPILEMAAGYTAEDPIFGSDQVQDLAHVLHERAVDKDAGLVSSQLSLALWDAEHRGPAEAAQRLEQLTKKFPGVPAVWAALARVYQRLEWQPESLRIIRQLYRRFPNHVETLHAALEVYDAVGDTAKADAIVQRILALDPDSEVELTRALAREDYAVALDELRRLSRRRPDRKDLVKRIHDVMVGAGNQQETWKHLERAVKEAPREPGPRTALADARLAHGTPGALREALVDAIVHGAPTEALEEALDLVEGMTELEPYRIPAHPIIRAYEQAGRHMPGTAARVLDYAAVWVRSDGSSRMLEHEIVRLQSSEAIQAFSEQQRLAGLTLNLRVIKQDGRILEPEYVSGKPTVTLPHLEVGDYVETEHVISLSGADRFGSAYVGPHWFFREPNVAYARSELVVVAPAHKPLLVETSGNVPEPEIRREGAVVVRRWRVDFSPAAPVEPLSPPANEFLPNVRVGWGVDLEQRLRQLSYRVEQLEPVDPRIVRIAQRIVKAVPGASREQQARLLFRWVIDNVEPGEEIDGRRVVIGKRGNRWHGFIMLCRALGIPIEYAMAKNRFTAPATGSISQAEQFVEPLLRVQGEKGPVWLILGGSSGERDKYLPFGYLPPGLRGTDAYLIAAGREPQRVRVPSDAGDDTIAYSGNFRILATGGAEAEFVIRSTGKHAMDVRAGLSELPPARLRDTLESEVVGRALRGARLVKHTVNALDSVDRPLEIVLQARVPGFVQKQGSGWLLAPPFTPTLSRLALLPARKTPLVLSGPIQQSVVLRVELPPGVAVRSTLRKQRITDGNRTATIRDRVEKGILILDRELLVPAGRISTTEYPSFVRFARQADDALARSIHLEARSRGGVAAR